MAVAVSIVVTGAALHLIFGFDWRIAFLWGAVLASTDAAAVFSVLRNVSVSRRLVGALELESGMNDAAAYLVVVLLASGSTATWIDPFLAVYELVVGALIGLALGWLGARALRRSALPATGLYPLATVAVSVLAFSAGSFAHASGLLAAYVASLVLGNSKLPHRNDTLSFAEGLGWLSQIGLFVLLGLFMSPSRLLDAVVPGLVAGIVVTFLARPISVAVSLTPFRMPWREQAFLSWAGLRGAVPIVLAMIPITEGVPGAEQLVDAVFVLVIVLTVVQGSTLPLLRQAARPREGRRGPGDRRRRRTAGRAGRGAADVHHPRRLPACTASTCASCGCRRGATVSLLVRDGVGHTPAPDDPPAGAGPTARGRHRAGPRGDRAAHPRGRPRGPLRPLARRDRPGSLTAVSGNRHRPFDGAHARHRVNNFARMGASAGAGGADRDGPG